MQFLECPLFGVRVPVMRRIFSGVFTDQFVLPTAPYPQILPFLGVIFNFQNASYSVLGCQSCGGYFWGVYRPVRPPNCAIRPAGRYEIQL
jgi:hypothetical protein